MSRDATSRRAAAELVRQLASGRLTNDEFEARWPASADPALSGVRDAAWFLYSDLRTYRLTGADRLPFPIRRQVARWVLFLHSDLPYEWPVESRAAKLARSIAGLLTIGVATRRWKTALQVSEDADVWPFFRRVDYRRALRVPRLLRRAQAGAALLRYASGEDVRAGDVVDYDGLRAEVELVVTSDSTAPDSEWHFLTHGAGVLLVEPTTFGRVYVTDLPNTPGLVLVSPAHRATLVIAASAAL
jgi:hypothetical protein